MKFLQFTFIMLLLISAFSISSVDIIEETQKEHSEITFEENNLDKETIDEFFNEYKLSKILSLLKVHTHFTFQITKNFQYKSSILRPPIS
jgi:uncharacterized membrane protein